MRNPVFIDLWRRRLSLLVFVLLILSAAGGQAQAQKELSAKDRGRVFEKVWELVHERYYDPKMNGVNWVEVRARYAPLVAGAQTDEEFYKTLKQMTGEMNDAHTRFLTPREASEFRKKIGTTVGVLLSRVEGKTVVEKVAADSEAAGAGIKPGMIVRTIGGRSVAEKLAEAASGVGASSSDRATEILIYRRLLDGEPNTKIMIGLTGADGKESEAELTRRVVSRESEVSAERLSTGIGYIAVSSFRAPVSDKFRDALLELRDTNGLIIDLRYNGGGNISEVLRMAGFLLDEKRSFGKYMRRKGETKQSLKEFTAGEKGGQVYAEPVVILVSKYSASGSELFSSGLQEAGRARVIGTQTCGCLLGISRRYGMKGGGELHVSDIGFLSAQGKIYEKAGITPDKRVELKIEDLRAGFDRAAAEAETVLSATVSAER